MSHSGVTSSGENNMISYDLQNKAKICVKGGSLTTLMCRQRTM